MRIANSVKGYLVWGAYGAIFGLLVGAVVGFSEYKAIQEDKQMLENSPLGSMNRMLEQLKSQLGLSGVVPGAGGPGAAWLNLDCEDMGNRTRINCELATLQLKLDDVQGALATASLGRNDSEKMVVLQAVLDELKRKRYGSGLGIVHIHKGSPPKSVPRLHTLQADAVGRAGDTKRHLATIKAKLPALIGDEAVLSSLFREVAVLETEFEGPHAALLTLRLASEHASRASVFAPDP